VVGEVDAKESLGLLIGDQQRGRGDDQADQLRILPLER
jgi:hypothetical protein